MSGPEPAGRLSNIVRDLTPGYFALVMASGIISVGMRQHGQVPLSVALLAACAGAFAVLVVLNACRIVWHPRVRLLHLHRGRERARRPAGDGRPPRRRRAARGRAGGLAAVLGYVIPWTAVLSRAERPVLIKANGTWFTWVVAAQSVAASGATLQPVLPDLRAALGVVAVFAWSVGLCLYAAVGVMVSLRLLLYELRPTDLSPPYWVAMGPARSPSSPVRASSRWSTRRWWRRPGGLIAGVSLSIWAFATWLVPVLVAAGWWRHFTHRVPLRYEPSPWSMVFPMGMYAVAASYLGEADHLPLVGVVGGVGIWFAFAVWLVVLAAMLMDFARAAAGPAPGASVSRRSDASTYRVART